MSETNKSSISDIGCTALEDFFSLSRAYVVSSSHLLTLQGQKHIFFFLHIYIICKGEHLWVDAKTDYQHVVC